MAVGADQWPDMHSVKGFRLGTTKAGVRYPGRRDLVIMNWNQGSSVAGVFTLNKLCAAPVVLAKKNLGNSPEYFVTNTGNANAGTGQQGMKNAQAVTGALAEMVGLPADKILPFSTGVIGEPLPVDKICAGLPTALESLSGDNWLHAAEGIQTTDTRPKGSSCQFEVDGRTYTVTGISKGSGMIKPNMATMLAYIATDVNIDQSLLQSMLLDIANLSFNRITVDGDTSTNDSFMLVATGAAGNEQLTGVDIELFKQLKVAVTGVAKELAQAIVRDGEGATKFVTVKVEEAETVADALEVAYTVAHSPLVKTALFACDPNWGRILAAVGRAEIDSLEIEKINIWLNDVALIETGQPATTYTEEAGQQVMDGEEITIRIQLGSGVVTEEIWTTDLSHEYVRINAEYRS
ncbi:bifunctional ornithine acetyltransferase/N-acetylglutamate synthase [Endozoicomonas sp. OPT23]|uniref:bifunctional glutamate N-acetyltransferase/amino-acid acetyltransferase ArgJ n=1 Tax=Endozoicomonas sp. OPT23 TaxID=2072845 RepID=UPI00129A420B|nr:bifunctional glutamate N-acetyltransferase/amino-acid acetyltransferase ArgJ [Endozoicomonas sp. OPT23]MRI35369.1 bifunctional ornithine acetyltransferase/N-acetylglutamate synthase [Endozoicomonas sp. OPT23]